MRRALCRDDDSADVRSPWSYHGRFQSEACSACPPPLWQHCLGCLACAVRARAGGRGGGGGGGGGGVTDKIEPRPPLSAAVTYIYTSEVFPTSVRSTGFGFVASFARFGERAPTVVVLAPACAHTAAWLAALLRQATTNRRGAGREAD